MQVRVFEVDFGEKAIVCRDLDEMFADIRGAIEAGVSKFSVSSLFMELSEYDAKDDVGDIATFLGLD